MGHTTEITKTITHKTATNIQTQNTTKCTDPKTIETTNIIITMDNKYPYEGQSTTKSIIA